MTNDYPFTKMHGLGNDFIVLDGTVENFTIPSDLISRFSDRHFGIGFDQCLVIEKPRDKNTDFYFRFFNADGNEAEQCGNGARCLAYYAAMKGLTQETDLLAGTMKGTLELRVRPRGLVGVTLPVPDLRPSAIPFLTDNQEAPYGLPVGGSMFSVYVANIGNPHCILEPRNWKDQPISAIGSAIAYHPRFPEGVNVSFPEIIDRKHINLTVFERGAGPTLACGTGASATVAVGIINGWLDRTVQVQLPGGKLEINWPEDPAEGSDGETNGQANGQTSGIIQTGPTAIVYEGSFAG